MHPRITFVQIIVIKALLILATLLFAAGFFPYKPFIAGHNAFSNISDLARPRPAFNKVIFMVVDALRSDFVFSPESKFEFVQSLIRNGSALPFTAHASSPTITMPKVKAITTGSVPSFLDVILNFAESDTTSTLSNVDTWLHQLRNLPDGNLVMYGDDTWLKLFPDFFSRSEGTTSFFVSDFTEVDNNVTRHIGFELKQEDWNGFIMHFLGLDHIGHKSGPRSPHMPAKQREMDGIVQQIYEAIETESHLDSTLLILCGDHGMNDGGNHGGAAPGETSPALIFVSPKFRQLEMNLQSPLPQIRNFAYYQTVEQSDIAPSICALLGIPIPLNNLGVVIPEILSFWTSRTDRLAIVKENMRQMDAILKQTLGDNVFLHDMDSNASCTETRSDLQQLQCGWRKQLSSEQVGEDLTHSIEYLRIAQRLLSSTASNYGLGKMTIALFIIASVFIANTYSIVSTSWGRNEQAGLAIETILTLLYGAMMFASSFVEEEHHFWYWIATIFGVYLFVLRPSRCPLSNQRIALCLLFWASLRIIRRWNQTGQKFAGSPDICKTFTTQYPFLFWILFTSGHIYLGRQLSTCHLPGLSRVSIAILASILTILTITYKLSFTAADAPELLGMATRLMGQLSTSNSLLYQARFCFGLILSLVALVLRSQIDKHRHPDLLRSIRYILIFFLLLQTRVNNAPMITLFEVTAKILESGMTNSSVLTPNEWVLCTIILQHVSFFALGGSNAISSIDLSNAYNGVSGYNVIAVGFLTFVSNWIGPIYWAVVSLALPRQTTTDRRSFIRYANALGFFVSGSLLATMTACAALRTHLFVWTVFSPKYLYTMAWSIAQHIGVNVILVYYLDKAAS